MNLANRCRLCLNEDNLYVNMFDPNDATDLLSKMLVCLPLQIKDEQSTISKFVCVPCVRAVEEIYQFWRTVANNNQFFTPKTATQSSPSNASSHPPTASAPIASQQSAPNSDTAKIIRNLLEAQCNGSAKPIKIIQGQPKVVVTSASNEPAAESSFKKFIAIRKIGPNQQNNIELIPGTMVANSGNNNARYCRMFVSKTGAVATAAAAAAAVKQKTPTPIPKKATLTTKACVKQYDDVIVLNDDNDVIVEDDDEDEQPVTEEENGFDLASIILEKSQQCQQPQLQKDGLLEGVGVVDEGEVLEQQENSEKLDIESSILDGLTLTLPSSSEKQSIGDHDYPLPNEPEILDITE